MTETDQEALDRALAGDKDGFRVLVERYSHSLFRLAFRMTGNEPDAEDVVQESFLRAWRHLPNYDGRASFSTWVFRIATNCALRSIEARSTSLARITRRLRRIGNNKTTFPAYGAVSRACSPR